VDLSEVRPESDGRKEGASDNNGRVRAVDDGQALQFDWGSIQWLCSGELYGDAQQTFGYVQILPGRKNPLHRHPNSEVFHLTPGKSIHIPQGVDHDARNPTDRVARMLVAYPTRDRRVVMLEEGQE
jgi:quercetin dioxygenase-like cupin family protein